VKPGCQHELGSFPRTDYFFRSNAGNWHGYWSASGDEGEGERRRFYNFTREFLLESARERMKEMIVFGFVVAAAAWPVGYMVITVIKLLLKGQPLDR
jgi:hypothetical protein